jgi:hypothetical protein
MSLAAIVRGRRDNPDRILIYGVDGIGKSSWAAAAPRPVFVDSEDGTGDLDVARFPRPETWEELLEAIDTLTTETHDYRTVVIDTIDWVESMLWQFICRRDGKRSIEDYGYGKGYVIALYEWRALIRKLERLQREKRIGVILVGHAQVRTFSNPEDAVYDRYQPKLHDKAAALIREWCEEVLFARWETVAVRDEPSGIVRGVASGARVVQAVGSAAWDAKNRHSLPPRLPLDYRDFVKARKARRPNEATVLRASILAKLGAIKDAKLSTRVLGLLAKAGDDAAALARIDNRMTATVHSRKAA